MSQAPFSRRAIKMSRPAIFVCLTVAFAFMPAIDGQTGSPRFEDYSVVGSYQGQSMPPNLSGMDQIEVHSCFGGDPAAYANRAPNFAGHYIVQLCSCGTGCHSLVIWDASTGKTIQRGLSFGAINVGPFRRNGDGAQILYGGEQYRPASTLMIVDGCLAESCDCATRYYKWTGNRLKLILAKPVQLPRGCLRRGTAPRP